MPFTFYPQNSMFSFYRWQIVKCVNEKDKLFHLYRSFCYSLVKLENKKIFQDLVMDPIILGTSLSQTLTMKEICFFPGIPLSCG